MVPKDVHVGSELGNSLDDCANKMPKKTKRQTDIEIVLSMVAQY